MSKPEVSGRIFGAQLIGASPAHVAMLDQLRRIAASEAPTLIEGETGSGKELAARAIHYDGPRCDGPFVPVNCGALPDTLIESELFGVQRGAFTDARQSRRGLVAEAERGTLFLDEVDAPHAKAQVTLLRFLEDHRYRPVGTSREHSHRRAADRRRQSSAGFAGGAAGISRRPDVSPEDPAPGVAAAAARAATTSSGWPITSSPALPPSTDASRCRCIRSHARGCASIPGPVMFASWKTGCTDRS
jgi:MoxR-like ATPase